MTGLLLAWVLTLAPFPGAGAGAPSSAVHDLHVSYGQAAVEDAVVLVRIRLFLDDLENALRAHSGRPGLVLGDDPATDAAFMAYFSEKFTLSVDGAPIPARIVASGRDELDREPVWWYAVQFDAPHAVTRFRVRNTLLLELFDDQHNIVKFVRFPEQTQRTYSFGRGEEEFEIAF